MARTASPPRADGAAIAAELGGMRVTLRALAPDVIRVRASADGNWLPRRSWAVVPDDDALEAPSVEVAAEGGRFRLTTSSLVVDLHDQHGLSISTRDGRVLVRDAPGGGPVYERDDRRSRWSQEMPDDRRYYGFGERTGLLEKRGRRYTCWTTDEWRQQGPLTDSLYVAVPFYLAVDPGREAFGVFLNSTYRSAFDLTALDERLLRMEVDAPELDWYFIFGPQPADVIRRFTGLVGRPPLPPRWALGYHQARWSYASADEVSDVARRLRHERIPADVIHLDIDHMDRHRPFTWDADRFPDPRGLVDELRKLGFRTTVVVDPAVPRDPGDAVYAEGHRNGYFIRESREPDAPELTGYLWPGEAVIPDFTRPDVREWWGQLYATYTDTGVAGFVNDMNEPAMHERPIDEPDSPNKEPPPDTPFGARGAEEATHAEVRNVYASLENRATVEGLRRAAPGARPFVVTRAGFAGVQRDAIVWTGDNASVWEHLEMSLPQLLNLGLSGIPITGADVGGFFADCPPELLVRWAQLGAFYPFCRNNSAIRTTRQEPWTWGEPTTSRYRRAIELRYRLLPYLYTCIHEAAANGLPVLRPLFLDHADDKVAHDVADEAMVGRDLLIAPMLRPGKSFREVYLPGGGWYDLRSHEYLAGPNHVLASAGLDEDLPIFARAGSIIPMAPVMAWTEERPVDPLTLRVFLDDEGRAEGSLYEDDGVSLEYVDGLFSTTVFEARLIRPDVVAIARRRAGPFTPPRRRVEIVLVAPGSETRRTVDDGPEWEIGLERKVGGDR